VRLLQQLAVAAEVFIPTTSLLLIVGVERMAPEAQENKGWQYSSIAPISNSSFQRTIPCTRNEQLSRHE
jgi:hypothetical protein